ncbi:hypothetical protein J8P63_003380 [Salmonella enterica]|nr:hypothetical protein [Salmonella enterica]
MKPVRAKDVVYVDNGKKKLSPVILEQRAIESLSQHPYKITFNGFVGEYKGTRSRISLTCGSCGKDREVNIRDVIAKGTGCISCGRRLYKFQKSPCVYVLRCGEIGKVGITDNLVKRISGLNFKNQLRFERVYSVELADKETALRKEELIKEVICKGGAFDIKNGHTETFRFNEKNLKSIKNLIAVG